MKVGPEPGPERGIHETHAPKESKTGMWSSGWAGPGEGGSAVAEAMADRGEMGKAGVDRWIGGLMDGWISEDEDDGDC